MPAWRARNMVAATVVAAVRCWARAVARSRRLALRTSVLRARASNLAASRPTVGRPCQTAMVAGIAPWARTACSACRAVSRFTGQGRPWQMRVDSRATMGRPARTPAATSGCSSSKGRPLMRRPFSREQGAREGESMCTLKPPLRICQGKRLCVRAQAPRVRGTDVSPVPRTSPRAAVFFAATGQDKATLLRRSEFGEGSSLACSPQPQQRRLLLRQVCPALVKIPARPRLPRALVARLGKLNRRLAQQPLDGQLAFGIAHPNALASQSIQPDAAVQMRRVIIFFQLRNLHQARVAVDEVPRHRVGLILGRSDEQLELAARVAAAVQTQQ